MIEVAARGKTQEIRSYVPLPKQKLFHESDAEIRAYIGGYGAGKSLTGCEEGLDLSVAYPRNFGLIARKTYRELVDSTQQIFFSILPQEWHKGYKARDEMITLPNGSVIVFRSLDDVKKFASMNLGWWYIDEASEIEDESVPLALMGRLRLNTVPWRGGYITSNPPTVEHWIHEWFEVKAFANPTRYFSVKATTYENPHLPKHYVKLLEEEYGPDWVRRYLMGEYGFISKGTPIWTHFNQRLHVVPSLDWLQDRVIFRSWDFGFNHPCVTFHQIGPNRTWHVLREIMGTRILLNSFADEVIAKSNEWFPGSAYVDVGDPAGHQHSDKHDKTSIEILRDKGVNVRTRRVSKKKTLEDVDVWLQRVRKGKDGSVQPAFIIDKDKCPITIAAFEGGYAWPKTKDGVIRREEPLEDGYYEHPADTVQYAYTHMFLGGGVGATLDRIITPSWRFS